MHSRRLLAWIILGGTLIFLSPINTSASEKPEYHSVSGLVMTTIEEGTGAFPDADDQVQVHFIGKLIDGTIFEDRWKSERSGIFPLNKVIPCWREALQRMREGERAHLVCPPAIAYGMRSRPGIPPGATLVFDVELISVRKASPTPTVTTSDEDQIAKALAILAGAWLLKKASDKPSESSSDNSRSTSDQRTLYIGSWGSWIKHSPLSGGEHREAWVRCQNGLSFEVEEHLKDSKHWFQRDAGAVLFPKKHNTLDEFIRIECGEGSGLHDHDRQ